MRDGAAWALPQLPQKLAEARTAAPHCSQNMVLFIVPFPLPPVDIDGLDKPVSPISATSARTLPDVGRLVKSVHRGILGATAPARPAVASIQRWSARRHPPKG